MKSYSARSTERTIKKFSNLIASKTKPGINATNILLKLTNYNSNLIRQLEEDEKALSEEIDNDEEFDSLPGDDAPQVWGKVEERYLDPDDTREICQGVTGKRLHQALTSYYKRAYNNNHSIEERSRIMLYYRLWKESTVHSSKLRKVKRRLTARGGQYVMSVSNRFGRLRDRKIWFVAEVLTYFVYKHCGETKLLAFGRLFMSNGISPTDRSLDKFGVPIVKESPQNGSRYAVFDVQDIVHNVGLVEYNLNLKTPSYKVIWPYAVFGERLDGMLPGKPGDVLDRSSA